MNQQIPEETAASQVETGRWRNRIVGHGVESPDQLLANPKNWRLHPRGQQDAIAGVLSDVGWVQSIIVNRSTGFVVDGHARVSLALQNDEPSVPIVYVELSEEEEAKILAALDTTSQMAIADGAALRDLVSSIEFGSESLDQYVSTLLADANLTALATVEAPEANDKGEADEKGGRRIGREKAAQVKAVFTVEQVAVVERAIRATGEKNRGEALVEICQAYLDGNANSERQFDFLAQGAAPATGALRAD